MSTPVPRRIDLSGPPALEATTALLLRARSEDPMFGLYEAADLQWWSKDDPSLASNRSTFWLDADDQPIACFLRAESAPRPGEPGRLDTDILWRPSQDDLVRQHVHPTAVAELAALPGLLDRVVAIVVDERDAGLRQLVEAAGFRRQPDDDMIQLVQRPSALPAPLPLPQGMRLDDDRSRPPDQPHHLAKRNGAGIADRLRACSLYRPDLDLCLRTASGDVAAYGVCWLDPSNGVGLFEPVRTEEAYQRQGLGRALMTEAIRRLMANGAGLIKITTSATNPAAKRLYEGVGFVPAFAKLSYAR